MRKLLAILIVGLTAVTLLADSVSLYTENDVSSL